ncbi:MAG: phosphotransferase family protein [Planctomycetales bacterium]
MIELTPETSVGYLQHRGWLRPDVAARVEALAWGVSNVVFRVTPETGEPFILKQSRQQLRTRDPWFSRLDRIWREAQVMRVVEPILPPGTVPRVLYEDRENYLFLMEAAPADHVVWKQSLLEGQVEAWVARFLGACLAALHRQTAGQESLREQFGDTEVFVQLRVDPFYRKVAAACPQTKDSLDRITADMLERPICLVHADFSPKNVLLAGSRVVLVDFETGHYGDPAFDLGFFLSHLLLKAILHRAQFGRFAELTRVFWEAYRAGFAPPVPHPAFAPQTLVLRMIPHLAGCMWARIDGTSKIDYLPHPEDQQLVRDFCLRLFQDPPNHWEAVLSRLQAGLSGIPAE